MERIGVVVNPIAGMGGRVGLKGTDGVLEEARERGADPRAPERAVTALENLYRRAPDAELFTVAGEMGADAAREAGYEPTVVIEPAGAETSAEDTREAVRRLVDEGVDLVLFVGGDGTAVDVAETLEELDADVPMLGVPAGVKIYSSVFAVTPAAAGRVATDYDRVEVREVNDIDEDAYREGSVQAELKAVARVPVADALQSGKQLAGGTVESLAEGIADEVEDGVTYVFGPGSTVGAITEALGFDGSPLGVDVWRRGPESSSDPGADKRTRRSRRGEVLVRDGSEDDILAALGDRNVVIVSPIGGQGFIFGRGNHQISPAVIRRSDVVIVASKTKLDQIGALRVDTDDEELNEELRGWTKVRVGRFERRMIKVL